MKIHILTAHFAPQLHPRAFRASELAIELSKRGHQIEVTNLTTIEGFDYDLYTQTTGVKVHNLGYYKISSENNLEKISNSKFVHLFRFLVEYFLSGRLIIMSRSIARNLQISEDTDAVIALSTPFMNIWGLSKYIENHGKKFVTIADSGDPFFYSQQRKHAIWFKWIEKNTYKNYDYLTIPIKNAIPAYAPLLPQNKIKIIPQGFRMDNLKLYKGDFTGPVRIAYAGVFYWDIRNPEFIFKYLNNIDIEYELYLFMRNKDTLVDDLLVKYPNLSKRVIIKALPRNELLYELSRMHFLLNIENTMNTQMPSKVIDYGISGRPILSCNSRNFSKEKADKFMHGIYEGQLKVDIEQYNIVNVATQFEDLIKSVQK